MISDRITNNLTDRHAAITDGVFAIAMTILVLEIGVPAVSDISSGVILQDYLINRLVPSILIYFISFYLVFYFWETNVILFNFKKIKYNILMLNMFTLATVCLIPFATGFLFDFYYYKEVNIFFSLLILAISLLYLLMFILLVRDNFKDYFSKKDQIKTSIYTELKNFDNGIEFTNLKLYMKGVTLTLFYILISPVISSVISLVLAFISPLLSLLSFILILIARILIRMKRGAKDDLSDIELSDDEREFINNIKESIYGE